METKSPAKAVTFLDFLKIDEEYSKSFLDDHIKKLDSDFYVRNLRAQLTDCHFLIKKYIDLTGEELKIELKDESGKVARTISASDVTHFFNEMKKDKEDKKGSKLEIKK